MDRVNILPNERVGLDDFEDGAGGRLVEAELLRQGRTFGMPAGRATGTTGTQARILTGFTPNTIAFGVDDSLTLNRGTGYLPFLNDQNAIEFGLLFGGEGEATLLVDFSTAPASSVQALWVRATSTYADFQNRVFWNPSVAAEFVDSVSTRLLAGWEATFQDAAAPAPPGNGEWVKIAQVTIDGGGNISAYADYRHLYYEGDVVGAFATEWGSGANDRNAARGTYGVGDQHLWVQAVRRQMKDIIGKTGWYEAPAKSLEQLKDKTARYVTVAVPGGPAAEGDYATLTAAITALNAANGGTILLREGTYNVTAQHLITKPIKIWGVEENVLINNQINVNNNWVFNYSAITARGSELRNIEIVGDVALSSDHAIRVNDCREPGVLIEACRIAGEVTVEGDSQVRISHSGLVEQLTNVYSDRTLTISGRPTVTFDGCLFTFSGIRTEGIVIESITNSTSLERARVSFANCSASMLTGTQHFLRTSASGDYLDLELNVDLLLSDGSQKSGGIIALSGGANYLKRVSITSSAAGANSTDPVLRVTGSTTKTDFCQIDGLHLNGNGRQHTMPSAIRTLVQFTIRSLICRDMHVTDWELPDSTISGSAVNRFMLVTTAPIDQGAHQFFERALFSRITNTGVNDVFHGCLGNAPIVSVSADATVEVASCIFDVSGHAYNTLASRNAVVLLSNYKNAILHNNKVIAGHWYSLLQTEDCAGDITGNILDGDSALGGTGVGYRFSILAQNGKGAGSALTVMGNKCLGLTTAQQAMVAQISVIGSNHDAIACVGNIVRGAIPGGSDIHLVGVDATLYANIVDNSYTVTTSGTQKPAVLFDHNVA